jgi:hypothetical protein
MADGVRAVVGLTGLDVSEGGLTITTDRLARMALPETFERAHLSTAQRDLAILTELLEQYPDQVVELQNAVTGRDMGRARSIAANIGLSEERFVAGQGGVWGLVIVIAIAAAVLLSSDSPPPPPPPPPPPESADAGAGNAGTG